MRFAFFGLVVASLSCAAPTEKNSNLDPDTRMVLKAVSERYKALGSWESTFTQETFSTGLGTGTFNEGRFSFAAPNKFRYSLVRPEMSDFICDGRSAWYIQYKDGRSKPAHVRHWPSLKGIELDRYLILLRGVDVSTPAKEAALLKDFKAKGKRSATEMTLELEPRQSAEIARLLLTFKSEDRMPSVVTIEDVVGNRSTIRVISSRQSDTRKVDASLFKPDFPKGSKVETLK